MAPTPIRVLIAEAEALVSAGFRVLLEREDDIVVVAEADTADETLELAASTRPDVLLMDLGPGFADIDTARRLLAAPALADVKVLILSFAPSDEDVITALRAGAAGVLLKNTAAAEFVSAVRTVAAGDPLLSPKVASGLIARLARLPRSGLPGPGRADVLTDREREVLALVAHGLSNGQIATVLVVTVATAKTHVSRVMVKLGVRDRSQLVVFAYEAGVVLPRASRRNLRRPLRTVPRARAGSPDAQMPR
jgi:DNA-binding NarL/FixJ family response regulator